jgi:hypothetical protein
MACPVQPRRRMSATELPSSPDCGFYWERLTRSKPERTNLTFRKSLLSDF